MAHSRRTTSRQKEEYPTNRTDHSHYPSARALRRIQLIDNHPCGNRTRFVPDPQQKATCMVKNRAAVRHAFDITHRMLDQVIDISASLITLFSLGLAITKLLAKVINKQSPLPFTLTSCLFCPTSRCFSTTWTAADQQNFCPIFCIYSSGPMFRDFKIVLSSFEHSRFLSVLRL